MKSDPVSQKCAETWITLTFKDDLERQLSQANTFRSPGSKEVITFLRQLVFNLQLTMQFDNVNHHS